MQPQPIVAVNHLVTAGHQHRRIRELLTPLLQIRQAVAELMFQFGALACCFLPGQCEDQHAVWDHLDDLLIDTAQELQEARGCVSRLKAEKDAKLRDAIIAIHEIRVVLSTMFCEHEEADHAYIAALELLTGVKQPAPVPTSLLAQSKAPRPPLKLVKKTTEPPPTVH
jgi:hypothetical protein